ncbi:43kDa postsynaptic protein [Trema orientale]|uniref:RING-type E3 ubiquitin transferase n=1 Tax=Trema orientale TaxID=63057 RepID=A0A2P5G0F8_TREOI|nr:43kDa postsynaptic protein [Trema orientale]
MSTSANFSGESSSNSNSGAATPKRFVVLAESASSPPPTCPHCNLLNQEPQQESTIPQDSAYFSTTTNPQSSRIFSGTFRRQPDEDSAIGLPLRFRPFPFLLRYFLRLIDNGFRMIRTDFRLEDGRDVGLRLRRILGRYIDEVLQHVGTTRGPPPAPQSAIEKLPTVGVSEEMSSSEWSQCAVCTEKFERGEEMTELPCNHVYHKDCVLPWLELHNTCPVCRKGLPSDDTDSESGTCRQPMRRRRSSVFERDQRDPGDAGSDEDNWRFLRLTLVFRFRLSEDEESVL